MALDVTQCKTSLAKLLMSNPLDFNRKKIDENIQHFFPGYIQNFSGYSRLKVLVVTGKNVGCSQGFFLRLKSSILDVK